MVIHARVISLQAENLSPPVVSLSGCMSLVRHVLDDPEHRPRPLHRPVLLVGLREQLCSVMETPVPDPKPVIADGQRAEIVGVSGRWRATAGCGGRDRLRGGAEKPDRQRQAAAQLSQPTIPNEETSTPTVVRCEGQVHDVADLEVAARLHGDPNIAGGVGSLRQRAGNFVTDEGLSRN